MNNDFSMISTVRGHRAEPFGPSQDQECNIRNRLKHNALSMPGSADYARDRPAQALVDKDFNITNSDFHDILFGISPDGTKSLAPGSGSDDP